ncbi:MAG: hypothetical protein ACLFQM_04480 [Fidelibacterota bacterium]
MLSDIKKIKTWQLFLFIVFVEMVIYYFTNNYVMTKAFYEKLLGDRLTIEMINTQFELSKRFSALGYLFIPLVTLIKITFFTLLIQFPLLLKFIEIPFKRLFRICAFSILPFLLLQILSTWRAATIPIENISEKNLLTVPLSINSFLNPQYYNKAVYQFLGFFHIFWIFWGATIYIGLTKTKKIEKIDSLLFTSIVFFVLVLFNFGLTTYFTKVFG